MTVASLEAAAFDARVDPSPPTELWLRAFALTVLIELPVYVVMLRGRLPLLVAGVVAVLLQVLTHPALWYLFPRFGPYWAWVTVAELTVTAAEAAALAAVLWAWCPAEAGPPDRTRPSSLRRVGGWAVVCAVMANGISTALGFVLL